MAAADSCPRPRAEQLAGANYFHCRQPGLAPALTRIARRAKRRFTTRAEHYRVTHCGLASLSSVLPQAGSDAVAHTAAGRVAAVIGARGHSRNALKCRNCIWPGPCLDDRS